MAKWEQLLDNETHKHVKKINKNFFCKKNKIGNGRYGQHEYAENENTCLLCGHIKKKHKEIIDEPRQPE